MLRSIRGIFPASKVNMGGIMLDQALPVFDIDQIDPFLLIHHWDSHLKGRQRSKETGIGPHPHRGFSPVTVVFKGAVHHRDSRGNDSVVHKGGVQWMNSGMGMIHSERPPAELASTGGEFEIVQFWVNVPARNKMDQPEYFPVPSEAMPVIKEDNGKVTMKLLTGNYQDKTGPVRSKSPLFISIIESKTGGKVNISYPKSYSGLLYQLNGKLLLNNSVNLGSKQLAWFKDNGTDISIECLEPSRAILLTGEPIGEEVTASGPFVMNTHTEILQAMRDYQMGKMGILIEEFKD
jgi:hypothetical protein